MSHKFKQKVSVFKNTFDRRPSIASLDEIVREIKYSSVLKKLIAELRGLSSKDEIQIFKQCRLKGITVSGVFANGHAEASLVMHSGMMQMDFDFKDFTKTRNLQDVVSLLKYDPYTYVGFISPSGNGYKVIVQVEASAICHRLIFDHFQKYYFDNYGLKIDPACKDVGRLCFLSSDPDIHIDENAKTMNLEAINATIDAKTCKRSRV